MKKFIALSIIIFSTFTFTKDITVANLSHRQFGVRLTYSDGSQSPIFNLERFVNQNQYNYAKRVNYAGGLNLDSLEIIMNNAPFKNFTTANSESTGKSMPLESCSASNGTLTLSCAIPHIVFNPFLICVPNPNNKFIQNIP